MSLLGKDIKGMQRIAETSDKDVLLMEVHKKSSDLKTPQFDLKYFENFSISETIMRRFNYSSFVQSHSKNSTTK